MSVLPRRLREVRRYTDAADQARRAPKTTANPRLPQPEEEAEAEVIPMTPHPALASTRRPLDPRKANIGLDANALNRNGTDQDRLVERFCQLVHDRVLRVVVAGGVRNEIQNPKTPAHKKAAILPRIFNLRPGLTESQHAQRRRVRIILQGNARPNKHAADASHLCEAAETGCSYFITRDRRILRKRSELHEVLPPSLTIVTLEDFFDIFDAYCIQSDEGSIKNG